MRSSGNVVIARNLQLLPPWNKNTPSVSSEGVFIVLVMRVLLLFYVTW